MKVGIDINNDGVISDDEMVDLKVVRRKLILMWTMYGGAVLTGCSMFMMF
jgi:hypothetical protein